MDYGKLITQVIESKVQKDTTPLLLCNVHRNKINFIIGELQQHAKSLHIVYENYFDLVLTMHSCSFNCDYYSSNWYQSKSILEFSKD